jgi:ATP-dependent helicase HrpA
MIALRLGDPADFPFIDPPHSNAIREGYRLLRELGAIDTRNRLTKTGRIMADLPIDPCISRIIIAARENNCIREIKIISAILAIQDPRIRPAEREQEADTAHKLFAHPHSDFMSLLNIWDRFQTFRAQSKSWSRLKKFCKLNFLSFQRMREWLDLHDQLERILKKREGFDNNVADASYEQIHKALLPGFLRNVACRKEKKIYRNTRDRELMIFPGSHQFSRSGEWIVAASFIETRRLYALTVATIEPEWIEDVAPDLCRYSWTNPVYHKKNGSVMAFENVSLFGLRIISGRKVNFGRRHKKNRKEARDIFINAALVEGALMGKYAFLQHNLALVRTWEETEERLRKRGIVADPLVLQNFYDSRLADSVFDRKSLNGFLKRRKNKKFLFMREEDILLRKPEENELADYPHTVTIGNMKVQLEYNFTPATPNDGVTFRLPVDFAHTVSGHYFDWLVPGLLREKLTFLLKGLPKSVRRQLVPVNRTVDRIFDDIDLYSGSFYGAVEASILKQFRLTVRRSDWPSELPSHLKPGFLLFDEKGKTVRRGKDLQKLLDREVIAPDRTTRTPFDPQIKALIASWEEKEFKGWDFTGLPRNLPLYTSDGEGLGFLYPCLVHVKDREVVQIRFEKNRARAEKNNRKGMLHLYRLQFPGQYRSVKKMCNTTVSGPSAVSFFGHVKNRQEAVKSVLDFILRSLFDNPGGEIESRAVFEQKVTRVKTDGFYQSATGICNRLLDLIRQRKETLDTICKNFPDYDGKNVFHREKYFFFNQLLEEILSPSFLKTGTADEIENRKRYLQSLKIRVERFSVNPAKDETKEKQLLPYLNNLLSLEKRKDELSDEGKNLHNRYKQMIAEFRISIFSPEIKTAIVVSEKKLRLLWQEISQTC